MRKFLTFIAATLVTGSLFAGGVVTNTNQSATWVRLPARNASLETDAVYYNPAGLMKLENGFHFSLSNQSIFQTRKITNSYGGPAAGLGLNDHNYKGEITALAFPSIYAAYKMDKFAFSLGFGPVGGGGGAEYDKGLPSFEMDISDLVPLVGSFGIPTTKYSADIYFKGSSVFFGYQANVSYKINDLLAVAVGARLVAAKNTYEGYIKSIKINPTLAGVNPTGAMMSAPAFFTAIGQPVYAGMTADREVDVEETGSGFAPKISLNIAPSEKLNFAVRYEFKTKLELTTKVKDSKSGGIFVDGEKVRSDMPALLAFGVDYKLSSNLKVLLGGNYFFDKSANYGHKYEGEAIDNKDIIDNNGYSVEAGLEYNISKKLLVSGGYIWANQGVNSKFQSDQTYFNATHTFGAGGAYSVNDKIKINLGVSYTVYLKDDQTIIHYLGGNPLAPIPAKETYTKSTFMFGVGVDFRF